MPGNVEGGKLAAATNKQLYGLDFYHMIGAIGGQKSRGGGFASNKRGADGLTGRERASVAGAVGGHKSKKVFNKEITYARNEVRRSENRREYQTPWWRRLLR